MTKFGHGNGNWSKTKDLLYVFKEKNPSPQKLDFTRFSI